MRFALDRSPWRRWRSSSFRSFRWVVLHVASCLLWGAWVSGPNTGCVESFSLVPEWVTTTTRIRRSTLLFVTTSDSSPTTSRTAGVAWFRRHQFSPSLLSSSSSNHHDASEEESNEQTSNKNNDDDNKTNFDVLQSSLRARAQQLQDEQAWQAQQWRRPDQSLQTYQAAILPDWIRRFDVDRYPLAACGSCSGQLFVVNLETRQILAATSSAETIENDDYDDSQLQTTLRYLYGDFDGGGTLAVAFAGTLLCEARRSGGVHVHRLVETTTSTSSSNIKKDSNTVGGGGTGLYRLVSQGSIRALQQQQPNHQRDVLVTCLHLQQDRDDYLWVGTADGRLMAFPTDEVCAENGLPLPLQSQPEKEWIMKDDVDDNDRAAILSLSINHDLGCAVVTTASGAVHLINIEEEDEEDDEEDTENTSNDPRRRRPRPPTATFFLPRESNPFFASTEFCRSATIVAHPGAESRTSFDDALLEQLTAGSSLPPPLSYSIVCGGKDGTMFQQRLALRAPMEIDFEQPFRQLDDHWEGQLIPFHSGAVTCLASPLPGLVVSAAIDGTMRVWDIDLPNCVFQFAGYKVWIGSLWTDGRRLVSDGADNTLVLHDFGGKQKKDGKSNGEASSSNEASS